MLSRLTEAFSYQNESEIERLMLDPEALSAIDFFFTADGPTKIIITIQEVVVKNAKSEVSSKKLKVFIKDMDVLPKVAVYFLKVKKGKDNDDHYAIDPTKISDGALSFGIVRSPLESLEAMVRCVYKPLIQEMPEDTWGVATNEQKNEFSLSVDAFSKGLQESIRSLTGGLELKPPDERVEALGVAGSSDAVLVTKTANLLQEWCTSIERYLDDTDRSRWENADSGPDTEVNYWKSRMQRLNKYSFKFLL